MAAHAAYPRLKVKFRADAAATPTAYVRDARGAALVHFACHAGVGDSAAISALYLAPDLEGRDRLDFADIANVSLDAALVFLSACRSGAGRPAADGTVGLAREFLRAGARAVVASYWNVSDKATALLVEHFYDAFLRGRSDAASALRLAMLATRSRLAGDSSPEALDPSEWGPFFVLGDGGLRAEFQKHRTRARAL